MASAACGGADDPSETDQGGSTAGTTEPAASIAEPTTTEAPVLAELLTVDDMPEAGSWSVAELPAEFWAADSPNAYEPFSVHMCDPMVRSVWSIVPPADEQHRVARQLRSGVQGVVLEAVFSGDSSDLQNDYATITQTLANCLDGPIVDPNLTESGWELVAEELPTTEAGDANLLIRQRLYSESQLDPTRPFCDHRLAVVVDDNRLVLVDYTVMGGMESVSDDDFVMIVQNAAQRIAP